MGIEPCALVYIVLDQLVLPWSSNQVDVNHKGLQNTRVFKKQKQTKSQWHHKVLRTMLAPATHLPCQAMLHVDS